MKIPQILGALALAMPFLSGVAAAQTNQPLLNPLFADHMVLQRGQPITFSGAASVGSTVAVTFAGEEKQVRAGRDNQWRAEFAKREAQTGLSLFVRGASGALAQASDISVGDVFLCSGQSNMVVPVSRALNPQRELSKPIDKRIRLLRIDQLAAAAPQSLIRSRSGWVIPSPDAVKDFSAVCMFFGRNVAEVKEVPVGLVHAAWGGSQIEAWIPAEGLRPFKVFDSALDLLSAYARDHAAGFALIGKRWEDWWRNSVSATDLPWLRTPFDIARLKPAPTTLGDWKNFDDPDMKRHAGMVWYYRTVDLTVAQAAAARRLSLGEVAEIGSVWLNGKFLGSSGGGEQSLYDVPKDMLKEGANVIAVSAYDSNVNIEAGLLGPSRAMILSTGAGDVSLGSGWRYSRVPNRRVEPPRLPWEGRLGTTSIYNGMIAPLGSLPLAGAVWYQGESNAETADAYKPLLKTMLATWRAQFRSDLPFVIVQLANFGPLSSTAGEDSWARVREAQREIAEEDPNAALAVTIDAGEKFDIHPPNKAIVAARAFQAARAVVYGEKIAPSGPRSLAAKLAGGQIMISFSDYSGALMAASANRPFPFMVCSTKTECTFADARIEGNIIVVDVPAGVQPVWVRYCWDKSPICNLYDSALTPAGPFELKITR